MDEGFRALGVAETSNPLEREPVGFGNGPGRDRTSSSAKEDDEKRRETFPSFREKEDAFFSADRWLRGPVDPAGALVHVSDRPLTCASGAPAGDGVAVGGTDHAVRVVGVAKDDASAAHPPPPPRRAAAALRRSASVATLRGGHREWVTCVTHDVTRGHVVSGGMDSCVYVWARRNVFKNGSHGAPPHETVPTKLEGHGGSVSDVLADDGRVASASYDKTVRLWRLQKTQKSEALLRALGRRRPQQSRRFAGTERRRSASPLVSRASRTPTSPTFATTRSAHTRSGWISRRWRAATAAARCSAGTRRRARWYRRATRTRAIARPCAGSKARTRTRRRCSRRAARTARRAAGTTAKAAAPRRKRSSARARARRGRGERNRAVRREPPRRHRGRGRVRHRARPARGPSRNSRGAFFRNSHNSKAALSSHALAATSGDRLSCRVAPDADVAFVGDGAGHVHCVDVAGANTGGVPRVAFALGAHRGATRALVATRDGKLCAAGDDGRVASYAKRLQHIFLRLSFT